MSNRLVSRTALLIGACFVLALASTAASAGPLERRTVREVTLPVGTALPLTLDTYVASDSSRIESPVHAHLRRAVFVDDVEVLPAGTRVSGIVTEARRSARVKGRARLAFRFTSLSVDADRYAVQTTRWVRQAAGTKGRDAATIGIPAGAGAVIGALTNGKKGTAIGSAVGGAAGTGIVLSTRGKEVRVGRGAAVAVRLLKPLRVSI
jgi:hypothetical protein